MQDDRDTNVAMNDSIESIGWTLRPEIANARNARYVLMLVSCTEPTEGPTEVRPQLKEFISRVIVPILVEKYVAELKQVGTADRDAKTDESRLHDDYLTLWQLAERWSCSLHTLHAVLHSPKAKLLRFDENGEIPIATVEEFERKNATSA